MNIELTGRKVKVTAELRKHAEEGMARIEKIVGRGATAHIIFASQKHIHSAEVTVNARHHTVVGQADAQDSKAALRTAIEKAEKQAIRWKKTQMEKKRKGSTIKALPDGMLPETTRQKENPQAGNPRAGNSRSAKGGSMVSGKTSGLHIVHAPEAMALRPMTIEEAVKEAEAGNREVLVFRDLIGDVKVLHCSGDGMVRLIEVL